MKKKEKEQLLVQYWLQLPENKRQNYLDVITFTEWIKINHPDLFKGMHGDPYQSLKAVLHHHIPDKR